MTKKSRLTGTLCVLYSLVVVVTILKIREKSTLNACKKDWGSYFSMYFLKLVYHI